MYALGSLWLALAGCKDESAADTANAEAVTYERDIRPIVERHCARCHSDEGSGAGDFTDPTIAAAFAERMLVRIDAGEMPPPASDPDCRSYQDDDRFVLDPAARDAIAAWIDGGKVIGDPVTLETPPAVAHLDDASHRLQTAAPYTPVFADANQYRCFVLDWDEPSDLFLTGFEFLIDQASHSHHAVLFQDTNGKSAEYITDPATQSWDCDASPDWEWMYLHAWAPGSNPVRMTPGTGLKIAGGSKLVLQMHYYDSPSADEAPDQPGYALTTATSVDTEVYMAPLGPENFRIPAGDANYTASESYDIAGSVGLPLTITVYGGSPHMHVLGTSYNMTYRHPDGSETCLMRGDYDFDNQAAYWYDAPAVLPPDGGTIDVSCTWDNSAANPNQIHETPQDVTWGENTDAEMCFAFLYFSYAL